MERTDFLTRRDFLQKAIALGGGALLEALLCKEGTALAQSLVGSPVSQLNVLAQTASPTQADQPQAPANSATKAYLIPDIYTSHKTQIADMQKGKWEGLFYLASDLIQTVSKQYDIPEDLIHALCFRESTGIPTDRSKVDNSYATGAVGLAQVMWFHAREPDGSVVDLTDIQTNLVKMAQIFNRYKDKHANDPDWVRKTLYDYNAGPNRKFTSAATLKYAEDIIALWKDPRKVKEDFIDRAWADVSLLYWELLPQNPFREPFVQTGVDFGEAYAGQPHHTGLDFGGPKIQIGAEIRAVADGKVIYAGKMYDIPGVSFSGRGHTVVLEHTPTNPMVKALKFITTGYCHMSEFAPGIAPGALVKRGQVIGYVGVTGWTTGPHLHFECAINTPVNPVTRKMAREDGWFHPYLVLPPNRSYPGSKRLEIGAIGS